MSKVRVSNFAVSIDGFGAGPGQNLENPIGINGLELMDSFFHTRVWREMHGQVDGETGTDNEMAALGFVNFWSVDTGSKYVRARPRPMAR